MKNKTIFKFGLIGSLYITQAIPIGFFREAVPTLMRKMGLELTIIGLLAVLLQLPWLFKFLWAPLLDRFGIIKFGWRRSWIIPLQTIGSVIILFLIFFDMQHNLLIVLILFLIFNFFCATQDIATDGLAVEILTKDERGPGNGIQVAGHRLGIVLGGGVILIIFEHAGWSLTMLIMALFFISPLIPVLFYKEKKIERIKKREIGIFEFIKFFKRPGNLIWGLLIIPIYKAGEGMTLMMLNPLLIDIGLSLTEIGILVGTVGFGSAFLGAMFGGFLIPKIGRKNALILFGIVQVLGFLGYLIPAYGMSDLRILYVVVPFAQLGGGLTSAILYTVMMDRCNIDSAGSDFTIQQTLSYVGAAICAGLSGLISSKFGYHGNFLVATIIMLSAVLIITWISLFEKRHFYIFRCFTKTAVD